MHSCSSVIPFLFIILFSFQCQQILINYEVIKEAKDSFLKYFYDQRNGYYLDVGAYDPIYASTTLALTAQGWNGINIEASPERAKNFFQQRTHQLNINCAVGKMDQFATLYDDDADSRSTVSRQVYDYTINVLKRNKAKKITKIAELSLKQICDRYFERKINFFNLDIEGYGAQALLGNDWTNPKCRPDFILSENNYMNDASKLPKLSQIFTKQGYVFLQNINFNDVYVLAEKHQFFLQKAKQGIKWLKKRETIYYKDILGNISKFLGVNLHQQPLSHYSAKSEKIYLYFSNGEPIYINKINQRSNELGESSKAINRPILIFHYNPNKNTIFVTDSNYQISYCKIVGKQEYFNLRVKNKNGDTLKVYIFNHKFSPFKYPKIAVVKENYEQIFSESSKIKSKNNQLQEQQERYQLTQIEQLQKEVQKLKEELKQVLTQKNEVGQQVNEGNQMKKGVLLSQVHQTEAMLEPLSFLQLLFKVFMAFLLLLLLLGLIALCDQGRKRRKTKTEIEVESEAESFGLAV